MGDCSIEGGWGCRPETPRQVADRLEKLLTLLRPIAPAFRRWYQVITEDHVPEIEPGAEWLVSAVAAKVCTGDLGEPAPALGYMPITLNAAVGSKPRSDDVYLKIQCGSKHVNEASLRATRFQDLDPELLTYPIYRRALLAISEAFEPDHCQAGPFSLWKDMKMSVYARGPIMTPSWMTHLSPPLARRVTPPPDLVSERFADGSLFLAATDETFDPDNFAHVAAAHRLFAIIDPLQEKLPREQ